MTTPTETAFLRELDKKLWTAADKLRREAGRSDNLAAARACTAYQH